MTAAQTLDGLSASPHIVEHRLSSIATYQWTASQMMGACGSGPAAGVENGFDCSRSTDVWGIALDAQCRAVFTWPVQSDGNEGATKDAKTTQGTYVAEQTGGPSLCAPAARTAAAVSTPSPTAQVQAATSPAPKLPNTSAASAATAGEGAGAAGLLVLVGTSARRRRRRRSA